MSSDEAYPAQLAARLRAAGLDYEVVNAGVSGDTSAGGLRRLEWSMAGDVRVLVVALGANDGLRGLPPKDLRANLARIIETARARRVRVVLAGMEAPPNFGATYTRDFRAVYRELAQTYDVTLIPFFLDGVAGVPTLNQADGIHPTAEGQRIVASTIWRAVAPLVGAQRVFLISMIELRGVSRTVQSGGAPLTILHPLELFVPAGQSLAITGPSGSGKSTLLGLIAGLDAPTTGAIVIDGVDITRLGEDALARLRGSKIGFVFQFFHLIPSLTARENVLVPMELAGRRDASRRADALLDEVGLRDRGHHYPSQLSGGEQQRVAIARALANDPPILLADEPTGNLDSANGRHIMDLLVDVNRARKTTLVLVTHDAGLAAEAAAQLALRDGRPDFEHSRLVQLAPPA